MSQSSKPVIKPIMFLLACCFFLWLAPTTSAFAGSTTPGAITISMDPAMPAGCSVRAEVPVNQVFKVTFNVPVKDDLSNVDQSKISLSDGTTLSVFQGADKKSITFAPKDVMLNYGQDYIINIAAGLISDATLATNVAVSVPFHSANEMKPLIVSDTLNTVIRSNSPRTLNVIVPKKYMTKFDIANTTIGGTDNPQALTNVDIKAEIEVDRITVSIDSGTKYNAVKSVTVWNAGFSGVSLTNVNDITLVALDKYGRILETKVIKFNPLGYTEDLSSLKSLSVQKTLGDLILNDGKLFKAVLGPYTLDDLSIGIVAK